MYACVYATLCNPPSLIFFRNFFWIASLVCSFRLLLFSFFSGSRSVLYQFRDSFSLCYVLVIGLLLSCFFVSFTIITSFLHHSFLFTVMNLFLGGFPNYDYQFIFADFAVSPKYFFYQLVLVFFHTLLEKKLDIWFSKAILQLYSLSKIFEEF